MRKHLLLACALLAGAAPARPPVVVEPPIPAPEKARLAATAAEARDAGAISPAEYRRTLAWLDARPCAGIDRSLTARMQQAWAPAIARQQHAARVEVLESLALGRWRVVEVENHVSDEPYLFYPGDPATTAPLTAWAEGATIFETTAVARWAMAHAPDIPPTLARCFAWHVTLNHW